MTTQSSNCAEPAALVVGAGGGIGSAIVAELVRDGAYPQIHAVSRAPDPPASIAQEHVVWHQCDHGDEDIAAIVDDIRERGAQLQRVVICIGMLHRGELQPEKALEQVRRETLQEVLETNTVLPTLWLSALTPLWRESRQAAVAVLSARIGSITDNRLGGWYSYRASKAALNMVLKTAAIELARRNPQVKLLAFHPGTTDTALSAPFQSRVPPEKLFSPAFVARRLLAIMDAAEPDGELSFLDWAGEPVPW